jgi:hypothetical protein
MSTKTRLLALAAVTAPLVACGAPPPEATTTDSKEAFTVNIGPVCQIGDQTEQWWSPGDGEIFYAPRGPRGFGTAVPLTWYLVPGSDPTNQFVTYAGVYGSQVAIIAWVPSDAQSQANFGWWNNVCSYWPTIISNQTGANSGDSGHRHQPYPPWMCVSTDQFNRFQGQTSCTADE